MLFVDRRDLQVLGLAVAMTTLAEVFYLVVWGMVLFPEGSLSAKVAWTATCGIAMGAVIGTAVLFLVEGRLSGSAAVVAAAIAFAAVASACALLCAAIDAQFTYFGGAKHTTLFIVAGIGPAAFGGLIFGCLLYGKGSL